MASLRGAALCGVRMLRSAAPQASKVSAQRGLATTASNSKAEMGTYVTGFLCGLGLYGTGRWVTHHYKQNIPEGTDLHSQEFRDKSMNQGVVEACAGGLEWGGMAWSTLSLLQALEAQFATSPFITLMGAPRVALVVAGVACAGFAIRGEETLIMSARKPLLDKKQKE